MASPHDGIRLTLQPEVRAAVAATPNEGLQGLVGSDAFGGSATSGMAYYAADNYFAFMDESGADITEVMRSAEYMLFDPYTWIGMNYPPTASGGAVDATPDAWRAWNAR